MPSETFSSSGQVAILATAMVTLVTTIATLLYQFVSAGRRHRWEVEATRKAAEAVKKGEVERQEIAHKVEKAEVVLNAKLDENTAISRQAFVHANNVNEKLKDQAAAFDKLLAVALTATDRRDAIADDRNAASDLRSVAAAASITAVKNTVDGTADQVNDIHHAVIENGNA